MNRDILNELFKLGIMLPTGLKEQIEMARRSELLKKHPYSIFYASDGRWATHLPDSKNGRRLIKRKNKTDLENAIVKFYESASPTFAEVYRCWRKYQDTMVTDSSITKYDSDEKRYFNGQAFAGVQIDTLTSDDVEVFMKERIDTLKLCQSATKTLYHYLDRVFEFAIRHSYIEKSPMQFMKAKDFYKYTHVSSRAKKSKIIPDYELGQLLCRYERDLSKKPDNIPLYGVIFSSLTGMRVGEIAALMWDDIYDDYILVNKSQKYNPKTKEYYISKTKNTKIRKFPLTKQVKDLLARIAEVERIYGYLTEFVFSDYSGPINFRKISSCIKNKCRQIGIETVGIHSYRKTVNSVMAKNGVPASIRAALLGHSIQVNEKYYTFDASSMDDKILIMDDVNESMR